MDEEIFNLQMRKFLKKVGITSQREIEKAVREAVDAGRLNGTEKLDASVRLSVPALGTDVVIEGRIALE